MATLLLNIQEGMKKKLSHSELVTLVQKQHPFLKQGTESPKTLWGPKSTCKHLPAPGQRSRWPPLFSPLSKDALAT